MRKLLFWTTILVFGLSMALSGCKSGDVPSSVQDEYAKLGKAARDAGGDYDKLPAADKQMFLQRANGDEKGARDMVSTMSGNTERRSRK